MITALLIIHALLAVTLLGAITHQALSVLAPVRARAGSFIARFRAVPGTSYANAVIVIYIITAIIGGVFIYPAYRLSVRVVLEQMRRPVPVGMFDLKEHLVTVGLGILPVYWYYWRQPLAPEGALFRFGVTAILRLIVWYGFIVGHILNNMRGFGL